jgi:hypothetical protein
LPVIDAYYSEKRTWYRFRSRQPALFRCPCFRKIIEVITMHTGPGITQSMESLGYKIMGLIILIPLLAATGCTSRERVYENIYEGLQMREQIVNPSQEPVPPRPPDYSVYKRDREDILQDNKELQE